jgi:uncharacterized membrane protein
MTLSPATVGLATGTFLASAVECVEAFTIVLAMGLTRSWRAAVLGTIAALAVLAAVTFGRPALTGSPIGGASPC